MFIVIFIVIFMNMNVRMSGIPEKIMDAAIHFGLAKTKTDALLLGLVELERRYSLLERIEDDEDVRESKRILREIREGKQRLISAKEFEARTGVRIGTAKEGKKKKN